MLCIRIMKYLPWWFTDIASNGEKKTKYSWKCSLCKISECFATFVPLNVFGYEYMYIYWETKKESLHDQPTTKITHKQTMYHSLYVIFLTEIHKAPQSKRRLEWLDIFSEHETTLIPHLDKFVARRKRIECLVTTCFFIFSFFCFCLSQMRHEIPYIRLVWIKV